MLLGRESGKQPAAVVEHCQLGATELPGARLIHGRGPAGENQAPRAAALETATLDGSSSANTPHSRIRRAISCEYCPPKSSTSTSSCAGISSAPRSIDLLPEAHAHASWARVALTTSGFAGIFAITRVAGA